jgi:hypothetical protein
LSKVSPCLSFSLVIEVLLSPGREFIVDFDLKLLGGRDDFTNDVSVAGVLISADLDLCCVPRFGEVSGDTSVDVLELLIDLLLEVVQSVTEQLLVVACDDLHNELLGISFRVVSHDLLYVFVIL